MGSEDGLDSRNDALLQKMSALFDDRIKTMESKVAKNIVKELKPITVASC